MFLNPALSLLLFALIIFVAWAILWPDYGLYSRWQRLRQASLHVRIEDTLKHIYESYQQGRTPTLESIAGKLNVTIDEASDLITEMSHRGLVEAQEGYIRLTTLGADAALHIIRAHRLWETYLADATGFAESSWHHQAERLEHRLTSSELTALDAQLSYPTHDPHGDPIPTATGTVVHHDGKPLPEMGLNTPLRIVHLEDEPDTVFAQLIAEGLTLGQAVQIVEKTPQRIRFWANGDEHVLAPIVAGNISVVPETKPSDAEYTPGQRLSELQIGETATVASISPACRGMERRRFLDLGILPGTVVSAEMVSPWGDPTAYRIRDALIALRREQADLIYITGEKETITNETEGQRTCTAAE